MNNLLNNKPLLLSLAVNVFLAAFVLGRVSAPSVQLTPSLLSGPGGGPEGGFGGGPPGGGPPGSGAHAGAAAALSMFRPEDLFTREEMDKNTAELQPDFDKIKQLREDLAAKLKSGPVTEDELLVNFAGVDQTMADVQATMQQKAAQKIVALSPEERTRLADRLLYNRRRPPPPPQPQRGAPGQGAPGQRPPGERGPDGMGPDGMDAGGPEHHPPGEGRPDRPPPGEGPPDRPLPGEGRPDQPLPGEGQNMQPLPGEGRPSQTLPGEVQNAPPPAQ